MKNLLVRISTFTTLTLLPAVSFANDGILGGDGTVAAPELDPSSAATALALLLAGVMYMRRPSKQS